MRDASDYAQRVAGSEPYAQLAPRLFATVPLDLNAETAGEPVPVVANHGRWVVGCPDCHAAQLTHPADRRFLCNGCGNVANGRRFRPVTWPKNHAKIGQILDARENVELRNWQPGETVASLRTENEILSATPEWAHPRWQGHTHRYPKTGDGLIECLDCTHPVERWEIGR